MQIVATNIQEEMQLLPKVTDNSFINIHSWFLSANVENKLCH